MAWTGPRTYVNGEVQTSVIWNQDVRDNLRETWRRLSTSGPINLGSNPNAWFSALLIGPVTLEAGVPVSIKVGFSRTIHANDGGGALGIWNAAATGYLYELWNATGKGGFESGGNTGVYDFTPTVSGPLSWMLRTFGIGGSCTFHNVRTNVWTRGG